MIDYPGVYVSPVSTAQPPTGGASTSIAAFVGRTPIGPINTATSVLNYADYTRVFGGLAKDSAISYQANAFFNNGGDQAVVVRLYASPTPDSTTDGAATVPMLAQGAAVVTFVAANPGAWGNELSVTMTSVPASETGNYKMYGLSPSSDRERMFDLEVSYDDGTSPHTETFRDVTFAGGLDQQNRVDKVLERDSQYLRYPGIPCDQTLATSPVLPAGTIAGVGAGGVDSAPLTVADYLGNANDQTGLYALDQLLDGFNILCVPPDAIDDASADQSAAVYQVAAQICVDNRAMLILDPPSAWTRAFEAGDVASIRIDDPALGSYTADQARNAAIYFPRVVIADPLANGEAKVLPPCGFMAAAWASTDASVGVWKAPAGLDTPIGGIIELQAKLDNAQNGLLNPQGINALRSFAVGGDVIWGARTLRGADALADQYKYIPVRRLLLYIETSLIQDTQWAVFEQNDAALWSKLQAQVSSFMAGLFSQGAFAGSSQSQAFFVNCDATTTTAADQAAGIVNVLVGFAPTYPAEFVVVTISQTLVSS